MLEACYASLKASQMSDAFERLEEEDYQTMLEFRDQLPPEAASS